MRKVNWTFLLALVATAHVKESIATLGNLFDKFIDRLIDKFNQALETSPIKYVDLDATTLGKAGYSQPWDLSHGRSDHGTNLYRISKMDLKRHVQTSAHGIMPHDLQGFDFHGSLSALHFKAHFYKKAFSMLHDLPAGWLSWYDHGTITAPHLKAHDVKKTFSMLHELPAGWLSWYDDRALRFPLATKAMTSGVCYSIGDLCAQGIAGKNLTTLDIGRLARSGSVGFVYQGPMAHYWLTFLDQKMSFGGAWWSVVPKVLVDQGPMAILDNTIYSLLLGALAFRDPMEVLSDIKKAMKPGFEANIRFWPVIHFITFTIVPVELQVLWEDVVDIFWICILSHVNNEGIGHGSFDGTQRWSKTLTGHHDNGFE